MMSRSRRPSVSIYDYPEHLNPFNDETSACPRPHVEMDARNRANRKDEETKQKFWTFGRSRKRSSSFSIKSKWNGLFGKRKEAPDIREKRSTITTVSSAYKREPFERMAPARVSRDQQEFDEALGTLARRRKYTMDSGSRCSSSLTVNGDPARMYDGSPRDTTASIMGDLTPKPPARRFGQVSPRPTDEIPPLNFDDKDRRENGVVLARDETQEGTPIPPIRRFGNRSSQRSIAPVQDHEDDVRLRDENENVPEDYAFKRFSQDAVRRSNLSINSCMSIGSTISTHGRKKRRAPQPPRPVDHLETTQENEVKPSESRLVEPQEIARVTENIDEMTRKSEELEEKKIGLDSEERSEVETCLRTRNDDRGVETKETKERNDSGVVGDPGYDYKVTSEARGASEASKTPSEASKASKASQEASEGAKSSSEASEASEASSGAIKTSSEASEACSVASEGMKASPEASEGAKCSPEASKAYSDADKTPSEASKACPVASEGMKASPEASDGAKCSPEASEASKAYPDAAKTPSEASEACSEASEGVKASSGTPEATEASLEASESSQEASKGTEDFPRTPEAAKAALEASESSQQSSEGTKASSISPEGTKASLEASETPQEASKGPPKAPKAPESSKSAPKASETHQEASKCSSKAPKASEIHQEASKCSSKASRSTPEAPETLSNARSLVPSVENDDDDVVQVEYRRSSQEKLEISKDLEPEVPLRRKNGTAGLSRSDSFSVKEEIEKIERQIKALETRSVEEDSTNARMSIEANRRQFFGDLMQKDASDDLRIELKELPREQKDIRVVRLTELPVPVKVTPVPVKVTRESVKDTSVLVKDTRDPAKGTLESVKVTRESVKVTPVPVKVTRDLVKDTKDSVKATREPVKVTRESVKVTREPVKVIELHISEPIRGKAELLGDDSKDSKNSMDRKDQKDVNPIPKPRRHGSLSVECEAGEPVARKRATSLGVDKRGQSV